MSQKINPTLFRLGWTKQVDNIWFSFRKSKYGTVLTQDLLIRSSLERAFLQIGFLTSDISIRRTNKNVIIGLNIYLLQSASESSEKTSLSQRQISKIPTWKVYNLSMEWQKWLEHIIGLPIVFQIEWIPTYYLSSTLMAKQLQHLIERKTPIKKALDMTFSSRRILSKNNFSIVLPDTSYGNLNWWIWMMLNNLKIRTSFNTSWHKKTVIESVKNRMLLNSLRKSLTNIYSRKRRSIIPWIRNPLSLTKARLSMSNQGKDFRTLVPRIFRYNYISEYWILYSKLICQSQFWKGEVFQDSFPRRSKYGDPIYNKGILPYLPSENISVSLLSLGDYILSTQFQIYQGRFLKYKLSGRLNGVDMAQSIKAQRGSFKDPYCIQTEQVSIQTSWGTYGLSVQST